MFATTKQFLDDLGLHSLADLPALQAPTADAMERLQGAAEQADAVHELQAALAAKGMGDLFVEPVLQGNAPSEIAIEKEAAQADSAPENPENILKKATSEALANSPSEPYSDAAPNDSAP